jgi:hypothetical protein
MKYCLYCGFVGNPVPNTPGTASMEVRLWFLFLVPGLIYSAWRRLATYQGCAKCGNKHLVAADSAVAQAALLRLSPTPSRGLWFCLDCGEPIFSGAYFCEKCLARPSRARAREGEALVRI